MGVGMMLALDRCMKTLNNNKELTMNESNIDAYVVVLLSKFDNVRHTSYRISFTNLENALSNAKEFYPNKSIWGHDKVEIEFSKDNKLVTKVSVL